MMIRGYALIYALIVALMIAFFSSSLLLLVFLNGKISNLDNQHLYNQQLLDDGMKLFLEINQQYTYNNDIGYNLLDDDRSNIIFKKSKWGLYDVLTVKSEKSSKYYKSAIVGKQPSGLLNAAIYLSDNFKPLVVTGNTKIKGDILIPKNGIQQGYLDGISYSYKQLFVGKQSNSTNKLPNILFERINEMYNQQLQQALKKIESDSISNSFLNAPMIYYFENAVTVQKITIKNNCILLSNEKIRIKNNTKFENVIVIAPSIEVENGTSGSMQLFATDTLWLGENVKLNYPSVVCVNGNKQQNLLHISENVKIYGEVYSICLTQFRNGYNPHLEIEKGAGITGFCYSEV